MFLCFFDHFGFGFIVENLDYATRVGTRLELQIPWQRSGGAEVGHNIRSNDAACEKKNKKKGISHP